MSAGASEVRTSVRVAVVWHLAGEDRQHGDHDQEQHAGPPDDPIDGEEAPEGQVLS